jgi:hypothetical protein
MGTLERLMARVKIDSEGNECWLWQGAVQSKGYGTIQHDGRTQLVHRVAFELLKYPVPEGHTLDHLCNTKLCVNPTHLEPVTRAENRARQNDARDTCKRGHPLRLRWRGNRTNRHCPICEPYPLRTPSAYDVPLFDVEPGK